LVYATTRVGRAPFEKVGAIVHGGYKRNGRLGEGVGVAEKGDDCSFSALGLLRWLLGLVVVTLVAVSFIPIFVIVVVDDGARVEGSRFERAPGFRWGGA
jgi:hypothetical protein